MWFSQILFTNPLEQISISMKTTREGWWNMESDPCKNLPCCHFVYNLLFL